MVIRTYQPGDENQIVDLFNLAFSEHGIFLHRTTEEWIWRYKNNPGFFPEGVLIAEENGKIIGNIIITQRDFLLEGEKFRCYMIDDVAVHPAHRGKRIAKSLEKMAQDLAKENSIELLSAYTAPNSISEKIFLSLGFSILSLSFTWVKVLNLPRLIRKHTLDLFFTYLQSRKEGTTSYPKSFKFKPIKVKKRYNFIPFKEDLIPQIINAINKFNSHYLGWTPRDEEFWRWRRLQKPNFEEDDVVIIEEEGKLHILTLSYHNFCFTKSRNFLKIVSVDEMATDSEEIGICLMEEAEIRAKRKGAINFLYYIDEQDNFNTNIAKNSGFRQLNSASSLFYETKSLNLKQKKGVFYISKESFLGET